MSEILDRIVSCDISIEKPVMDGSSFSTIMVIGDAPSDGGKDIRPVDKYASLAEVEDAGWKEDTEIHKAARAAFMQEPKPDLIYIAVRQESQAAEVGNPAEAGSPDETVEKTGKAEPIAILGDGKTLEAFSETVKRVAGMGGWYGLALAGAGDSDYGAVAEIIESTEKIFAFSTQSKEIPLKRSDYLRTFVIYAAAADEYAHVAWLSKCFGFAPGSETWAFKELAGVTPAELTTREMSHFEEMCMNYYVPCANKNITLQGKMIGNEWIDTIRFRDWLKNDMQIRIFELFVKHPKVPYTDKGITLVGNQMHATLQEGQKVGGIRETEFDENDNPVEGYTVTLPLAASLTSAQRASRKLRYCKYTARLAGAIQLTEIQGNLIF